MTSTHILEFKNELFRDNLNHLSEYILEMTPLERNKWTDVIRNLL